MAHAHGLGSKRPLLLKWFLRSTKDDPQHGTENRVRQDTGDENIADCLSCQIGHNMSASAHAKSLVSPGPRAAARWRPGHAFPPLAAPTAAPGHEDKALPG